MARNFLNGALDRGRTLLSQILNGGTEVSTARRGLNFIQGSNVTLTVTDNAGNDRVDVTIAASSGTTIPAGAINMFGGSSAPSGWLFCDGSNVSRSTYGALFTAIGTTFGAGDGSTTFGLPDMRGRAPIGVGQGSGLTNRALGASGGAETHQLSTAEMPSHSHTGTTDSDGDHTHNLDGAAVAQNGTKVASSQGGANTPTTQTAGAHTHSFTTATAGSGTAHNNMQPWRALNFIIKT